MDANPVEYRRWRANLTRAEMAVGVLTPPPVESSEVFQALCGDCLHLQTYQSRSAQMDAHQERSTCEECGGFMCACAGCLG